MSNFTIEKIIKLIEDGEISKEELISRINGCLFDTSNVTRENRKRSKADTICARTEASTSSPKASSSSDVMIHKGLGNNNKTNNKIITNPGSEEKKSPMTSNRESKLSLSGELFRRKSNHDNAEFFKDVNIYEFYKKAKLLSEVNKKKILEVKECSFKPKINQKPFRNNKLSIHQVTQVHKKALSQEYIKEQPYNGQCTFQPKINPKQAKPRYMNYSDIHNKYETMRLNANTNLMNNRKSIQSGKKPPQIMPTSCKGYMGVSLPSSKLTSPTNLTGFQSSLKPISRQNQSKTRIGSAKQSLADLREEVNSIGNLNIDIDIVPKGNFKSICTTNNIISKLRTQINDCLELLNSDVETNERNLSPENGKMNSDKEKESSLK